MKSDNIKGNNSGKATERSPKIEETKMVYFQRRQRLDSVRESGLRQTGETHPELETRGQRNQTPSPRTSFFIRE